MLLIVALLSMLGTSWAQVDPQGPQIKLQAVFLNGDTAYVENALANEFTTTDDVNAAAIFTADEASGYLFQASTDTINFPSGYAVPAIRTLGLVGVPELTGYDAETVLLGTDYYPLDCSGNLNLLGITELDVPLVCLNTGLTNIVTGFGLCPDQGNTIVNFGVVGTLEFPLDCGLDATVITSFNAIFFAPEVVNPSTPTTTAGGPGVTNPVNPGTCSVTVSILVTTTTSFVDAGYDGPSTIGSGGSTTGANPYGCEPITSILGI